MNQADKDKGLHFEKGDYIHIKTIKDGLIQEGILTDAGSLYGPHYFRLDTGFEFFLPDERYIITWVPKHIKEWKKKLERNKIHMSKS